MKKNIKKPINKGVCKVPVIMQLEALECGAACLTMILAYYNKWVPLEQVREDCGVSRDGSNAKNILKAGKYYGFDVKAFKYEPETLKKEGNFPCIIHWNFNHFVVLDGFKGNKVYLNDPARGNIVITMKEFDESFTGIVLDFNPTKDFKPSGRPKSVLKFAKRRLKGTGYAIMFAMLTSVIGALMNLISPGFSRVFSDYLLGGKNPSWAIGFIILLGIFNLIQIILSAFESVYHLRINGKLAVVGSSTYMWKVLNLPIKFFSQRMAYDIQGRMSSNASIANSLINVVSPLLLKACMMVFYFVVMIRYSLILTIVGLISLFINGIVSKIISKKRINLTRVSVRDNAKLSSTTVSGIEMIETIKASGAEEGFFKKWSGYQAAANKIKIKSTILQQYYGLIPSIIATLCNSVIMFIGLYLTMEGEFTIGMITAFQGFLSSFLAPAETFITAGQTIQEMRTSMERVDDVMEYPIDKVFDDDNTELTGKLKGKVEINNLVFGYAPLADPLIKNFNLKVEPGKSVAIVGSSGCGKSTMSKLISGLYKPWEGEILFDGKPMNKINKSVFRGSLAVVDQDIILLEDTIANNIKMWDESIEDFEMVLAARDAQIHDDIMERPEGYNYKIIENGKDFSGGQRQRIEIARVLAQDPTIIILDEATSALDAKTEYEVVKSIRERGITCIVIAHRLSTIRSCDEIIVMKEGEIVNRGTHKELMETSEIYKELVTSE